jgi:hypothetical protein
MFVPDLTDDAADGQCVGLLTRGGGRGSREPDRVAQLYRRRPSRALGGGRARAERAQKDRKGESSAHQGSSLVVDRAAA